MRLDPPLDPTSPEARQWLEDELSRGVYQERTGLLQRLWEWLVDLLGRGAGSGGLPAWTVAIAALVAAAVIALVLARSVATERRMKPTASQGVFDGPVRTAEQHRAAARAAVAEGDDDTAVLEAYRALARSAVERAILDDLPGRTAHEASLALAPAFPTHAAPLADAADDFDAVRYGLRAAPSGAGSRLLALDTELARTRPLLADPLTGARS